MLISDPFVERPSDNVKITLVGIGSILSNGYRILRT